MIRTKKTRPAPWVAAFGRRDEPKKRKWIRPISKKRATENRVYLAKRIAFLARPTNQLCKVSRFVWGVNVRTEDVHHVFGRAGKLLTWEPGWMAVSRRAHNWLHSNPTEARALGWIAPRGKWNNEKVMETTV